MATDYSTAVVPPDVVHHIDQLHSGVETLQRELGQALTVWQTTLADEQTKFDTLRQHKELAWQEQDAQWARQAQSYEERLAEIKSEFESRLQQTEQNAARTLNELDDAWQRDKLEWAKAANGDEWIRLRADLETKATSLEERIAIIEQTHASEKETLLARIHELEQSHSQDVTSPTPETVKALQAQLSEFQGRASHSDELVQTSIHAIDAEITALHTLLVASIPDSAH